MNDFPLQSFVDLIGFDQAMHALEAEVKQVKKDVDVLEQDRAELASLLDLAKKKMHDMRKDVDEAELEMKDFEQSEIEEKKRLDHTSNQKEYQAVQKEIAALKKKQHDYEETLLVAWNRFEVAKKEHETHQVDYELKEAELVSSIEEKKNKLGTLQTDFDQRKAQRDHKTKGIPSEWLDKYVLMSSRVSNPVVAVVSGSCSACFYHLPPQDFLELRRKKMLQCKGCYRFLYIEHKEQPEQKQEQS